MAGIYPRVSVQKGLVAFAVSLLAILLFVAAAKWLYVAYDPPPAPFVGPPSEHVHPIEWVRQSDFETIDEFELEVNKLVLSGCEPPEHSGGLGGVVASLDCRQAGRKE